LLELYLHPLSVSTVGYPPETKAYPLSSLYSIIHKGPVVQPLILGKAHSPTFTIDGTSVVLAQIISPLSFGDPSAFEA